MHQPNQRSNQRTIDSPWATPTAGVNAAVALVLVMTLLVDCSAAANPKAEGDTVTWQQWRGGQRDGQFHGAAWPNQLSEDRLAQTWKVPLGPGYSGPIVASDRVFVTETQDKSVEVVRALDRTTGEELWRTDWDGAMKVPFFAASNGSWIRATPAFDGERLYVAGMRDLLVCLDAKSGKKLWEVNFMSQLGTPLPNFGFASSPLLWGDHLYVQAGASFMKLDKLTGKIVWRTLKDAGGMNGSAFASPTHAVIHGTPQLLVQTRTELAGVSPEDGTVLWKLEIPAFRGMNILTPTAIGNSVFTSSYGGKSFLFNVTKQGDQWQVEEAWVHKAQAYMSTPVVVGNHIYMHLRNQRFTCIDARTGESTWTTRPYGKYWSLVANGDQILALDQKGELLLIQANPAEFELVDRRSVADDAWAHLAVCGDELFVRALDGLLTFRWQR